MLVPTFYIIGNYLKSLIAVALSIKKKIKQQLECPALEMYPEYQKPCNSTYCMKRGWTILF